MQIKTGDLSRLSGNYRYKLELVSKLRYVDHIYDECKEDNWDDDGAISITKETVEYTKNFLKTLNFTLLKNISDIDADPDGYISIEWEDRERETFILISILGNDRFSCVSKLPSRHYILGRDTLINGTLPSEVERFIYIVIDKEIESDSWEKLQEDWNSTIYNSDKTKISKKRWSSRKSSLMF